MPSRQHVQTSQQRLLRMSYAVKCCRLQLLQLWPLLFCQRQQQQSRALVIGARRASQPQKVMLL